MHVLVFEPRYKGHHLVYVQMIVNALLELGCKVTVGTGADIPGTVEFESRIKPLASKVGLEFAATDAPGQPRCMHRQLNELVHRLRPDHVLVPSADGVVQQCGTTRLTGRGNVLGAVEAEGLFVQCRFAYPGKGLRQRLRYTLIRETVKWSGFSRLFFIDAVAHEALQRTSPGLAAAVQIMPDPLSTPVVADKQDVRKRLKLPEGKLIGMTGTLDVRKGVDRLIRAFKAANLPEDHRLLFAGVAQPDIQDVMRDELGPLIQSGRAIWLNWYLSDDELGQVFSAVDLMCAPYAGHIGPSGVIAKSAHIGTPVLATDYGWCGKMVPRMGVGWVCDTADVEVFADQLRKHAGAGPLERTALLERWFEFMSPQNFATWWTVRLRQRLGLPAARVLDWNWVVQNQEFQC